ncbi:hypothetical protein RA210_U30344 [Rubrivivax sp. A210]|nr:hypothetical protein RA210_U30344 [Rubrivivax sp. A210]
MLGDRAARVTRSRRPLQRQPPWDASVALHETGFAQGPRLATMHSSLDRGLTLQRGSALPMGS